MLVNFWGMYRQGSTNFSSRKGDGSPVAYKLFTEGAPLPVGPPCGARDARNPSRSRPNNHTAESGWTGTRQGADDRALLLHSRSVVAQNSETLSAQLRIVCKWRFAHRTSFSEARLRPRAGACECACARFVWAGETGRMRSFVRAGGTGRAPWKTPPSRTRRRGRSTGPSWRPPGCPGSASRCPGRCPDPKAPPHAPL